MELNREKLKRMFEDTKGNGGSANGGGGGGSLAGYATQAWVNEGFVSIDFFNRLFTVYGPGETSSDPDVVIEPNDLDSTIKNIKAMFGFWTDYYVSALGNGGDLGSTLYLSSLADVAITSPISDGQVLQYNLSTGKWTNATLSLTTTLGGLSDVLLTSPQANQVMIYDATNQKWVNTELKTINYQSIIGSGDISVGGGASGNYLPLTGGTLTNLNGILTLNAPTTSYDYGCFILFKYNGTIKGAVGRYKDFTWIASENPVCRLGLNDSGVPQYWPNSTGSTRYNLIHEGNISSYLGNYLPLTGGTLEALVSNGSYGVLNITNTYGSSTYTRGLSILHPNVSSGAEPNIYVGRANSTNNGGYIGFYYSGNGSSSNFIGLGLYGNDNILICNGSNNVGIGTTSPSYKLHVSGTIYATGSVTALSDARKKDVIGEKIMSVEQIADAPAVQFTWKGERKSEGVQVGSIAQYWQTVLPEVVMDKGGELSMQYGVTALVSAIITARKVVDHERRITELERENERLRTEIEQLRLN